MSNIDGASVLKTIIAFRGGVILRQMSNRKAAANAMLCFELYPEVRGKTSSEPLTSDITESGAYDVMMHHDFEMEKSGDYGDVTDYIYSLSLDDVDMINSAYTAIAEMLCDYDEIPVVGGRDAVNRIYEAIVKETTH